MHDLPGIKPGDSASPGSEKSRREILFLVPSLANDACPGLVDLHDARDGKVARIRIPGGYLTAGGALALSELADRYGDGRLDLTSRGNVQLRGIAESAGELSAGAAELGLLPSVEHDRARNIMASPLAGLAGRVPLRDLVEELDRRLRDDPKLAALPGRFCFALDDGSGDSGLERADLAAQAIGDDYELLIVGRHSGRLIPRAGIAAALCELAVQALTGVTPDAAGPAVAAASDRLPLGEVADASAAVVAAPLARLTSSQLRLAASLSDEGDVMRLAAAGRLVVPTAETTVAISTLEAAGLLVDREDPAASVTACSGLTCQRALGDVRSWAHPMPDVGATHWVGCERSCGRPLDAVAVVAIDDRSFRVG